MSVFVLVLGCGRSVPSNLTNLQLYNYPEVLIPTPQTIVLNRAQEKALQPVQVNIPRADFAPILKEMRSALDVSLQGTSAESWEKHKQFSLEFAYDKPIEVDLMVNDKLEILKTNSLLLDLERKVLVVRQDQADTALSEARLSDSFIEFMKGYSKDLGFPLPPASRGENRVEQLPLARPGQSKVEFLLPGFPSGVKIAVP